MRMIISLSPEDISFTMQLIQSDAREVYCRFVSKQHFGYFHNKCGFYVLLVSEVSKYAGQIVFPDAVIIV